MLNNIYFELFSIFLEKYSNCYILGSTGLNNQVVLMLNSNIGSSICLYQFGIIIFTYSKRFYCFVSEQLPSCYLTCWSDSLWVEVIKITTGLLIIIGVYIAQVYAG